MGLHLTRLGVAVVLLLAACGTAATERGASEVPGTVPASTTGYVPSETPGEGDAAPDATAPEIVDDSETSESGVDREERPTQAPLERVPASDGSQSGGGVPEAFLTEVMADAATRLGVAPSELAIEKAESVVWNDGSLGCPEPGVMYTQATVPGYWIVFTYGDTELDYRTSGVSFYTPCLARAQTGATELPGRCANC